MNVMMNKVFILAYSRLKEIKGFTDTAFVRGCHSQAYKSNSPISYDNILIIVKAVIFCAVSERQI
jgi:hypothetical protein